MTQNRFLFFQNVVTVDMEHLHLVKYSTSVDFVIFISIK